MKAESEEDDDNDDDEFEQLNSQDKQLLCLIRMDISGLV